MGNVDQPEFRKRMRAAREWAGLDQRELALQLHEAGWIDGPDPTIISNIENGKRKRVTPKLLEAIAELCRVPYEFLTDDDYNPFLTESTIVTGQPGAEVVTQIAADGHRETLTMDQARLRGLMPREEQASASTPEDVHTSPSTASRADTIRKFGQELSAKRKSSEQSPADRKRQTG